MTGYGHAFTELPQDVYEGWHASLRGYLPMDCQNFQESLLGARDREYAVCRLKPKLLRNMRASREAPNTFVCDEQIELYYEQMSGERNDCKIKPARTSNIIPWH